MSDKILIIKFLEDKRRDYFLAGNLYMNTANFFSKMEKTDAVRADENEGADESWQVRELAIADKDGGWIPIGGIQNPVIYRYNNEDSRLNIFCMYALPETANRIDDRNLAFGESAVVITDAKKFVDRFRRAAANIGRISAHAPIEYVKRAEYHGLMGPFRKFDDFSYQNEFRFALEGGNDKPVELCIGDIRDICFVCRSSELNQFIASSKAALRD